MNEELEILITGLKSQVLKSIEDIKTDPRMLNVISLHKALNALEESCGTTKTALVELFGFGEDTRVVPGEFYGLEPLEAAKRFLRKKGKTSAFAEIIEGMKAGSCDPGNEEELKVSLSRSTTQVVKVADDLYGLVEFFPHVKRDRKKTSKSVAAHTEEIMKEGPISMAEAVKKAEDRVEKEKAS